jgi:hypothetical protein
VLCSGENRNGIRPSYLLFPHLTRAAARALSERCRFESRRVRREQIGTSDVRARQRSVTASVSVSATSLPALMLLKSSEATFERVSVKTQPVSGPTTCPISDIENSRSRDSSGKIRPTTGNVGFSSPETDLLPANPRECRHFSEYRKMSGGDRGGWLG